MLGCTGNAACGAGQRAVVRQFLHPIVAVRRDGAGRLMDLGTKGSGRTPWSRFGDGKLTLKGAMRELLATGLIASVLSGVY